MPALLSVLFAEALMVVVVLLIIGVITGVTTGVGGATVLLMGSVRLLLLLLVLSVALVEFAVSEALLLGTFVEEALPLLATVALLLPFPTFSTLAVF